MEENKSSRAIKRTFIGTVTSDKMQKTIVVRVDSMRMHEKYPKQVKKSVSFKVHDEKNTAKIGDMVKIAETRPISKDKRWRLVEIIKIQK